MRTPTAPSIGGQRISKHRASSILTPTDDCDYCDCQLQESEKISERDTYCTIPGYSKNPFQRQSLIELLVTYSMTYCMLHTVCYI